VSTAAPPVSTIDAALRAAAGLTGMELVFFSGITETEFTFHRVHGNGPPGVVEGATMPRSDSLCARMLEGAPNVTTDLANEPAYADCPFQLATETMSYIGVPVVTVTSGIIGTLCAIDSRSVPQREEALLVLRTLADVIGAAADNAASVRVRRTSTGWQVEPLSGTAEEVEDLTTGMALADLLTPELIPPARPPRPSETLDEAGQLRVQVAQLQHALAARVVVEQAIGVLAERLSISPRDAFERLRKLSRSRGQKVHDLARMVVASVGRASESALPRELR
jgi:hypothetical protein